MKFFFVPGRKWLLAQAELNAVLTNLKVRHVELSSNQKILIYDIAAKESDVIDLFRRLGGFVKVGFLVDDPFAFLSHTVVPGHETLKEKVSFAISFYDSFALNRAALEQRNGLGMEIKKWLRNNAIASRFVSNFSTLETSAVLVKNNHVLDRGFEINKFSHPRTLETLWGVTLEIQDYEGFAHRDYDRPRVNKKKGMIPPKLARIMLNLAQIPDGGCVWDPFCGSGTILMEALVLGYSAIGSDIDSDAIEETEENLHWLCEEYWISHQKFKVIEHDVRTVLPSDLAFDSVVTETYLGPVLQRRISVEQIQSLHSEIRPLFDALGNELDRQMKKNRHGTVVAVVPGFRSTTGWLDMQGTFENHHSITRVEPKRVGVSEPLQWDRPNSIIRRNISQFSY